MIIGNSNPLHLAGDYNIPSNFCNHPGLRQMLVDFSSTRRIFIRQKNEIRMLEKSLKVLEENARPVLEKASSNEQKLKTQDEEIKTLMKENDDLKAESWKLKEGLKKLEGKKCKKTLYVSDSLVKCVDTRRVERELGGRLDAGQACVAGQQADGHPGRAYTTLQGSRGAKFSNASLEQRIPHLMGQQAYTHLVCQLPTPDITNLQEVASKEEQYIMVKRLATAAVGIFECTLRAHPILQSVLVLPRPPRADSDHLSELSEYSKSATAAAVKSDNYGNQ